MASVKTKELGDVDVKGGGGSAVDDPDNWSVAIAVRHALKTDPAVMTRVAAATDSSISHVEVVVQYRCNDNCQWCAGGVSKPESGRHFVIYTVRDTANYSGVMKLWKPAPKLQAKGGWSLYRVNVSQTQRGRMLDYCESQVGAGYRSLTTFACMKVCCPCCGYPTYADVADMAKNDAPGPKNPTHCSGYVVAALIYAGVLKTNDTGVSLDPFRASPSDLVTEMRAVGQTNFTLLDSIPKDLLPPPPPIAEAGAVSSSSSSALT